MQALTPNGRPGHVIHGIDDVPLPHRNDCGCAAPDPIAIQTVRERLQLALDTAGSLGLDVIDVHVCELRQLATWGIVPRPQDLPLYFYPWTIDDADPVFPLTVNELREAIAGLDRLEAATLGPPSQPVPTKAGASRHRRFV